LFGLRKYAKPCSIGESNLLASPFDTSLELLQERSNLFTITLVEMQGLLKKGEFIAFVIVLQRM
jgi:hypothetical protein